jgi:uncharacterized protein YdeI (YjbR/CyaY-like superfamily)
VKPIYFASPAELRRWFARHHTSAEELWVGYYKKATGKPSVTWQVAVEEALAVGWIDGVRYSVDDARFKQRFTPRRPGSSWSKINIATAKRLIASGRMRAAGKRAFEARTTARSGGDSLPPAMTKQFRANRSAWAFFSAQAPYYQRLVIHWVTSAKQDETRRRRLATLIADSAAGQRIKALRRPDKK